MRRVLGRVWIFAGTMHFLRPRFSLAIMPRSLKRWGRELVAASGVAEITGGVLALKPSTRRAARWWLLAMLVGICPANVQMAIYPERYPRIPPWALWARLPLSSCSPGRPGAAPSSRQRQG